MALAAYKDLCIDAQDPQRLGRFWAAALALEYVGHDDGSAHLEGPTPAHRVWVNGVPEPKTVKHRVHVDVHTGSVEELVALGATVVRPAGEHSWTVLTDPEGGEFCAFVRDDPPDYRLYEVVVDCARPRQLAQWWAHVFGTTVGGEESEDWWWLEPLPGAPFDGLVFVPVPEPKQAKNRVHWDVTTASVSRLLEHGARLLRPRGGDRSWDVLADPEGNEFCAFTG